MMVRAKVNIYGIYRIRQDKIDNYYYFPFVSLGNAIDL